MVPPPDTPESLDGQVTGEGDSGHSVDRSVGEGETAGNDPSTDSGGEAFGEDWTPPEMLADRYQLEEKIGQGGMGVVYRATDTQLDRSIAVKLISRGSVARFETEAKAIAALNHTNIAHVYEFDQQDDLHYIVMEHVEGESLSQRLTQGTIPVEEAIQITVSLCEALAHAHGKGIIHRDIKPSNVLLSSEGVPKLVDFGLARIESDQGQHTRAGATLGTIDYMSPEQRRDAAGVDHRSDLWSLGATFYEMLTGEPPHPVDMESIPESVHSTMAKVLKRKPDDRYQAADDFRDALKVALDSPVAHHPRTVDEGELAKGQCAQCGVVNDLTRKFCEECAAALRVSCLSCEDQIPVWDKVCGECGARQQERVAELIGEAEQHRASHDYTSAVQAMEQIPEPLRTTETSNLLVEMERSKKESRELLATIREQIDKKDLKGLLDRVTRALELRPDREDLQKIKCQLEEREKRSTLTVANAEQFLADADSVNLDRFTTIDDAAAEPLSKFEGELCLNSLTRLSDAAAESLSKHIGEKLSLESLAGKLSDSPSHLRLRLKIGESLGDLTSLSDLAAESLSRHRGDLYLSGLTSLSDIAAESLSKHEGFLSLNGLASLSDAAAESLSMGKRLLCLRGLTSLSDTAAESLSKSKRGLFLDLDELPASAAEILRKHPSFQDE